MRNGHRIPEPETHAGVALISVLLIVALLSAVVYQLLGRHSLTLAQSRNTLGFDQALAYAIGAEALARQALYEDFSDTGPGIDTLQEPWAAAIPPFAIDGEGFLEIQARDLNRCFNLNALADASDGEQHLKRFKALLGMLDIPDTVADAVRDWIDSDDVVHGFGAEDSEYLLFEPPYRAANGPIAHASELGLVAGMSPDFIDALAEYVCVLPEQTMELNVNTAPVTLLAAAAVKPDADLLALQALQESEREFEDIDTFLGAYPDLATAAAVLSVTSSYFEVQVRAQVGESTAMLTSQLYRNPETGVISLLSRDLGKDFRSLFEATDEDA